MWVRRWLPRGLALASGCLLVLAYPAPALGWLAWAGLVPVLLLCARAGSVREAAWRGSLAGAGFFLTLFQWVLPHVGLLAPVLGLVGGLLWVPVGVVAQRLLREPTAGRTLLAVVVLPSVWVGVEAVRSWEHLGGAWGLLGLTQWQARPVLALASLGGVWLLSFVLVAVNAGLAAALLPGRARPLGGALALGIVALVLGYGLLRPDPVPFGSVRVAGVQPGLVHGVEERFTTHLNLTRQAAGRGQAVVVWGQSSTPFDPARRPGAVARLRETAAAVGSDVLVNVDARAADGRIRKTTQQYGPDGLTATYEKRRLVPFGEYVPLRPLLGGLLRDTGIAEEDRAPGAAPVILRLGTADAGPLISYESMFPDLRRELVRLGADVTIVQGSLTSFHGTWAQPQQASAEAVRAVETGRSAVLVELNGTSAAFDAQGRRLAWMPPDERGIFVVDVPLYEGTTPYVRWGDWVPAAAFAITAVAAGWALVNRSGIKKRRSGHGE
ncbi:MULTISPECIES: apolipoprotein N-acyltransferase [Amycolatopsis]|uniref:Apolipoprotein N-acyltransferase n=1 Tax=Amycolatopsis thermalba TaxID=944492 RepID=A0ABY4NX45_9PSEU|nr:MULTISPECIES: apolipoprotein N-acyltransferase [Amycolatopsis]OXM72407.1 apolipoprotein N-acyltransferase [Amycolatopsis sp. KNN50.9b]UQS24621.1 apolipoprotein N-acyltransferase [Amycolatopsis thermalba]